MSMECKQCGEDLTAFIDGELGAADSEQVRSHLSICASCADEWRSLKEAADFIESRRNDREPLPESWNLVRARISAEEPVSPFWFLAPNRWRVAAAALVIIAASALGYLQYQQIQKKSLDRYMSQYMQEREAPKAMHPVTSGPGISPYADNPFIEVKATPVDNPFQSEDR